MTNDRIFPSTGAILLGVALILSIPLLAMQLTSEVNWTLFDFVFAGVILMGPAFLYQLAARSSARPAYRAGVGVALVSAVLIVWLTGAVGIIGNEANPANLMYFGVLAVGLVGALIARFRPAGMSLAMYAAAAAVAVVGAIALIGGMAAPEGRPIEVVGATAMFVVLFSGAALLFKEAARGGAR